MILYSQYRDRLLGKPSIEGNICCVCGKPATNHHHVVPKGKGGSKYASLIPTVPLCGNGNMSGCHGLAHKKRLHLNYSDYAGWVGYISDEPMSDEKAWEQHYGSYHRLPYQGEQWETYGRKS